MKSPRKIIHIEKMRQSRSELWNIFFCNFIYLFLEREEGREKERGEILM